MTSEKLIDLIIKDSSRYKSICKKKAGVRNHLADDLYQEAMLAVLEIKDDALINAYQENRIESYITGIINTIWKKRTRVKCYEDGKTSHLFDYSSTYKVYAKPKDEEEEVASMDYDDSVRRVINQVSLDYNPKIDQVFEATKKIIREDCESQEMGIRYKARVYNYSNNNIAGLSIKDGLEACENANKFAKCSNIPYSAIIKTCTLYKKILQEKLKPLMND